MYGLMFHHFYSKEHPKGQGAISAGNFEGLLIGSDLKKSISPIELMRKSEVYKASGSVNQWCVTFDDSLSCQYDVALPVLDKLALKALWFVYTSPLDGGYPRLEVYKSFRDSYFDSVDDFYAAFLEKALVVGRNVGVGQACRSFKPSEYLSEFQFYTDSDRLFRYLRDIVLGENLYYEVMDEMLREADVDVAKLISTLFLSESEIRKLHDQGHMIGLHSHNHPTCIGKLSFDEQMLEYKKNYQILADITGQNIEIMSHPCNSYSSDTFEVMRKLNVRMGFRSNMSPVDKRNVFELPREDHSNLMKQMGLK